MRIAAILCFLVAGPALSGQDSAVDKEKKQLSALVQASRKAKSEAKPKPVARITDANLKKSPPRKAAPKADPATKVVEAVEVTAPTLEAEAAALVSAEKRVRELEKELLRLEQAYYDESDPGYREKVVRGRFETTRKLLDDARAHLATMRVEEKESETPPEPE